MVKEILIRLQQDENYLKVLRESYSKGSATKPVPVECQRNLFGLNDEVIDNLHGNRLLDIGCGSGALVNFLREKNIDAEGIDSSMGQTESLKSHFMKQNITNVHPAQGCIPRPENHYQYVVSFQNGSLNDAFTEGGLLRDPRKRQGTTPKQIQAFLGAVESGKAIILEAIRVLTPGGKFVTYPDLPRISEVMGDTLLACGVRLSREEVNHKDAEDYMWQEMPYKFPKEYFEKMGLYARCVIEKK